MQTTATSGNTIAELLKKAAQMYEQGDQQGAEKLRAAAEALRGTTGPQARSGPAAAGGRSDRRRAGAGGQSGTSAASCGGEMVGQMLGQAGRWSAS